MRSTSPARRNPRPLGRSQTRICLFRRHRASWLSRRVRRAPQPEVAALVEDVEWFRRQRVAGRLDGRQVESAVGRYRFHPNNCLARPGPDQFVTPELCTAMRSRLRALSK
ncbi:hypothetical protein SBA6_510030 [Candidatus Sulfopaludibacter sp. SbA6]|nr:hypothetical protein SBA6_510030 [Candidatus Sulfopaludibacter sp. SbA6]